MVDRFQHFGLRIVAGFFVICGFNGAYLFRSLRCRCRYACVIRIEIFRVRFGFLITDLFWFWFVARTKAIFLEHDAPSVTFLLPVLAPLEAGDTFRGVDILREETHDHIFAPRILELRLLS